MTPSLLRSHCHKRAFPWGSLTVPVSSTGSVVHVDEGLDVRLLIEGAVFRSATTLIVADEVTECPCPSETVTVRVYCTFDVVYVWAPGLPVAVVPSPKFQAYVRTSRTFASDANAAKLWFVFTWTACDWSGARTGATLAMTGTIVEDVAVAIAVLLTGGTTSYGPAAGYAQVGAATSPPWSSLLKMPSLSTPVPPGSEPPTVLVPSADTWPASKSQRYRRAPPCGSIAAAENCTGWLTTPSKVGNVNCGGLTSTG